MDYTALAAWSGLIAALVAVVALGLESRRSRFALGVDLLLRLTADFNGDRMLTVRRSAAKSLLSGSGNADVADVLNFFGTLGTLLQRGALDRGMVWSCLGFWVLHWWYSAEAFAASRRALDHTLWSEVAELHKAMLAIEKTHRRADVEGDIRADVPRFLAREAELT